MGRALKRVPVDFSWPTNMIWKGYLNPFHSQECKACDRSGLNPETKKLDDDWYTHLRTDGQEGWGLHLEQEDVQVLIDADRLWDFTRIPRTPEQVEVCKKKIADGGNSWLPESNGYIPTAEEVNEWNKNGMGHDSSNRWYCVEARAKRLGVYGRCIFCDGEGGIWQSEEIKRLHEAWTPFEPPSGEGYQLWETTSEGSPVSPVFDTLGALCAWCQDNATTFGSFKASAEEWREMLDKDFVSHRQGNMVFI